MRYLKNCVQSEPILPVLKYAVQLVERILLTNLPIEFGEYLMDSGSDGMISGEIAIVGPPLGTMQADIDVRFNRASENKRSQTEGMKKAVVAKEALALLGISSAEAELLTGAFCGDEAWRLTEAHTKCSIASLCEFHRNFADTDMWDQLCSLWDQGLKGLAVLKVSDALLLLNFKVDGVHRHSISD